jgi:hypothetical protein
MKLWALKASMAKSRRTRPVSQRPARRELAEGSARRSDRTTSSSSDSPRGWARAPGVLCSLHVGAYVSVTSSCICVARRDQDASTGKQSGRGRPAAQLCWQIVCARDATPACAPARRSVCPKRRGPTRGSSRNSCVTSRYKGDGRWDGLRRPNPSFCTFRDMIMSPTDVGMPGQGKMEEGRALPHSTRPPFPEKSNSRFFELKFFGPRREVHEGRSDRVLPFRWAHGLLPYLERTAPSSSARCIP